MAATNKPGPRRVVRAVPLQPTAVSEEDIWKLMRCMGYLYGRWQDEQQYEDWADYVKAIRDALPPGAAHVRITKRPFRVTFQDTAGFGHRVTASSRTVNHLRSVEPVSEVPHGRA